MKIISIDHLVLTVASLDVTVDFYTRVLGMTAETFGPDNRTALRFGQQKINLHVAGREFEPKAEKPTPGSGDLCFIVEDLDAVRRTLAKENVAILHGPGSRTGAMGPIRSIYVRDPDGNLIELSSYEAE